MAAGTLVRTAMLKITADDGDTESKLSLISERAKELAAQNPDLKVKIEAAAATAKLRVLRDDIKAATAPPAAVPVKVEVPAETVAAVAALRERLEALQGRVSQVRLSVDDEGALAKLAAFRATLASLNEKAVASPGMKESDLAAMDAALLGTSARLKGLEGDLDDTGKKMDDAGKESITAKARFASLGEGINNATLGIPRGTAEMGMFAKSMALFNVATGVGEPLIAGLTVAAGGLAAGFVSAGAGLGIFAEVAKGVWGEVSTNITAYSTASEAIANGDTGKKLTADLKAMKTALAGLTGPQKELVIGASNAAVEWHNFLTQSTAGVVSVLVPALGMIPKALSLIKPFLAPVESALRGVVSMVSTGLSSGGMKSFMSDLAANAGPAITKLSVAIKNIVVGIGGILKAFMPVSQGMMGGLDKITGEFAKWGSTLTSHSGFKDLMNMFKTETPMAMNALKSLGGIIKTVASQMTGMDTFSNSKMLLELAGPVLKFANALLKAHPELVWLVLYLKLGADGAGKLKIAFQGLSGGVSGIKDVTKNLGNLRTGMKDSEAAASDATGAWGTFGGKLSGLGGSIKTAVTGIKEWSVWSKIAGAATRVWTGIQAAFDAVMDANPIVLIVIAVIALIAVIVLLAVKFKPVRDFFKEAWKDIVQWTVDAWHGIVTAFDAIVHAVSTAVSAVVSFIKAHWPLIVGIFLGPIALVVALVIQHWNQIVSITRTVISDVVSFFKALPGKIISALGDVGMMLFDAGKKIVQGLINGIKSMIGDVGKGISDIAHEITSHLPFSPAKKGPLSGRGDPRLAGQRIAAYLAQGMTSQTPMVTAAAAGMARAAGIGGVAGGAGGGGQPLNVIIGTGSADPVVKALVTQLQQHIRVTFGGNVQQALGRG